MKKIISLLLAAALAVLLAGGALCACAGNNPPPQDTGNPPEKEETAITSFDNSQNALSQKIGVTCWGSLYMPSLGAEENSLLRGAEYVRETGSRVIKLACGDLSAQYSLDDWEGVSFERSVDVFRHEVFVRLFSMDFDTFFISVPERKAIRYADGVSKEEAAYVEEEFYLMTKYLLETYRGSGKIFILQNWETDNAIGYSLTDTEDDIFLMRSYADYYNARQDGINRARDEFVMSEEKNVYVFGAIEINKLDASYTRYKAVDYIVPYTYCDLYTYSSYEYKDKGKVTSAAAVCARLTEARHYSESKLPPAENYPQPVYFGDKRLAVTEFGYPDRADGYGGQWQKMVAEGHLMAMEKLPLQYVVYWQLCCNEPTGDRADEIRRLAPASLRVYEFVPGDVNGFYLLRPDGERSYTYNYFKEAIAQNSVAAEAECPAAWK